MAKWVHSDVLDNGLNAIRNGATHVHLVKAYGAGNSFAAVVGNSLGAAAMTPADFTLTGAAGGPRTLTSATKTIASTANSGAGPDLHFVFVDTPGSRVLWATDETTDQVITAPNPVTIPVLTYTAQQPA